MEAPDDGTFFDGAVVHVVKWSADGDLTLLELLSSRLASQGARVLTRLAPNATHVLFQRKALASPEQKRAEEEKLRELYKKLEKVGFITIGRGGSPLHSAIYAMHACMHAPAQWCQPPHLQMHPRPYVVSPLWVQESLVMSAMANVSVCKAVWLMQRLVPANAVHRIGQLSMR